MGCHFLLQGIFPTQEDLTLTLTLQPVSPVFPALAGGFFTTEPPEKPVSSHGIEQKERESKLIFFLRDSDFIHHNSVQLLPEPSPIPPTHLSPRVIAFSWRVELSVETLVPNIPSHLPLTFRLPLSSSASFIFMSPCPRVSLTLLTFLLHHQLSSK